MNKIATLQQPVWRTKEGKKIPINKLEDEHLSNILNLLIKCAIQKRVLTEKTYLCPAFGGPIGDGAQMAFDQEFDQVMELTTEDYLPSIWHDLIYEAEKRKMIIPTLPDEAFVGLLALSSALKQRKRRKYPRLEDCVCQIFEGDTHGCPNHKYVMLDTMPNEKIKK